MRKTLVLCCVLQCPSPNSVFQNTMNDLALFEEDPETYERHYWQCRKQLGMTTETIRRDVEHLKTWLKNHPYLPSTIEGSKYGLRILFIVPLARSWFIYASLMLHSTPPPTSFELRISFRGAAVDGVWHMLANPPHFVHWIASDRSFSHHKSLGVFLPSGRDAVRGVWDTPATPLCVLGRERSRFFQYKKFKVFYAGGWKSSLDTF